MGTLIAFARNIRHFIFQGRIFPEIELVLITATKTARFTDSGDAITPADTIETIRIRMHVAGARKLADDLKAWADEADRERERLTLKEGA